MRTLSKTKETAQDYLRVMTKTLDVITQKNIRYAQEGKRSTAQLLQDIERDILQAENVVNFYDKLVKEHILHLGVLEDASNNPWLLPHERKDAFLLLEQCSTLLSWADPENSFSKLFQKFKYGWNLRPEDKKMVKLNLAEEWIELLALDPDTRTARVHRILHKILLTIKPTYKTCLKHL